MRLFKKGRSVEKAEHELILITPYIKLWRHISDQIMDALEAGVKTTLIVRKDAYEDPKSKMRDELRPILRAGARILTVERLHAKVYLNEKTAIVTSMNLHESSALNSLEFALSVPQKGEKKLFSQVRAEVAQFEKIGVAIQDKDSSRRTIAEAVPQKKKSPGEITQLINLAEGLPAKRVDKSNERLQKQRKKHARFGEFWSENEDDLVRRMAEEGVSIDKIAKAVKRNENSIKMRLEQSEQA